MDNIKGKILEHEYSGFMKLKKTIVSSWCMCVCACVFTLIKTKRQETAVEGDPTCTIITGMYTTLACKTAAYIGRQMKVFSWVYLKHIPVSPFMHLVRV